MFKRIVVPLDGSERAERAIHVAARIARATSGSIVLLQVIEPATEYDMNPARVPIVTMEDVEATRTKATDYLSSITQRDELEGVGIQLEVLKGDVGPTISAFAQSTAADLIVMCSHVNKGFLSSMEYLELVARKDELADITVEKHALFGDIAPTILSTAQSFQSDLIVMCSHGYTGLKRWSLGSVAQKAVRHSPVPVLVLRDGAMFSTQAQRISSALVPLDGSELAKAAIEPAAQLEAALAAFKQGKLHLLRVVAIPSTRGKFRSQSYIDFDVEIRAQAKQEAEAYMEALLSRLSASVLSTLNVAVSSAVLVNEDVAHAIIEAAKHDTQAKEEAAFSEPSIIAMATHGRGGIGRWALGSKTERVLDACKVPLMIIRPQHVKAKHALSHEEAAQDEEMEVEKMIIAEEAWMEA